MSKFCWEFDQDAIASAAKELGIDLPVHVRGMRGRKKNAGLYKGIDFWKLCNQPVHNIVIERRYLSTEQASKVIWHELTHARQAESFLHLVDSKGILAYRESNLLFDEAYGAELDMQFLAIRSTSSIGANRAHEYAYWHNKFEIEAEACAEANADRLLVVPKKV